MNAQDAKKLYKEARCLSNELFRESERLQNEAQGESSEERIKAEKRIVEKYPLLDKLFRVFLELLEVKKIKNVNMKNYTPEDIFKGNINTIIDSICKKTPVENDFCFYKCNIYAFYIITHEVLSKMHQNDELNGNSLWFFDSIYTDISALLTMYCDSIAKEKFNGSDISCGAKTYRNPSRPKIDVLLGIRHMLYKGTACDVPSTDLPNIAVFSLRNYIELWLRENFNAYMIGKTFIPVSKIFSVLEKNINEIKKDHVAKNLRDIDRHIQTLSIINEWINSYVHSNYRALFWKPHIILKYLNLVIDECKKAYAISLGSYLLFPPLIPEQAPVYKKICKEIQSPETNASG